MKIRYAGTLAAMFLTVSASAVFAQSDSKDAPQYKLLATRRTSTMQKEIDEISAQGYRILVGSPTSGTEMAVFLSREGTTESSPVTVVVETAAPGCINPLHVSGLPLYDYREALRPSTRLGPLIDGEFEEEG